MSAHPLSTTMRTTGAPRRFYVGLALFITAIVMVGFWPSFFSTVLDGTVDRPPVIHFHAAIYLGWLGLFITQTALAATGRTAAHVKLGKIGIWYGVVVLIVGLIVSFAMFAIRVRAGELERAQLSLMAPLIDMVVFAPLFAAAVYFRTQTDLHKRFMIVATTSLLIAAVGRMSFLGSPVSLLIVWNSPILLAMGYDIVKQRVAHPIYLGGMALLSAEWLWRRDARNSDTWADICVWLAGFFA